MISLKVSCKSETFASDLKRRYRKHFKWLVSVFLFQCINLGEIIYQMVSLTFLLEINNRISMIFHENKSYQLINIAWNFNRVSAL